MHCAWPHTSQHNTLVWRLCINTKFNALPLLNSSDSKCLFCTKFVAAVANSCTSLQYPHRSWPQSLPVRYQYSASVSSRCCLEFLEHYKFSFNMLILTPNLKPALRNSEMLTYWMCTHTIQRAESCRMFVCQVMQPSYRRQCYSLKKK